MNLRTEEISIDSALIHQWFLSKAHLPVMRDYMHPRLDELSLNHTAPQQHLQIAKPEKLSISSPKIIPVDLKSEINTIYDNEEKYSPSTSKIVLVDLKSEIHRMPENHDHVRTTNTTRKSSPNLIKQYVLFASILAALIIIIFAIIFI